MIDVMKQTFSRFSSHHCTTLAAALAYYTVFALPPLLYLLLMIVSLGMGIAYDAEDVPVRAGEFVHQQVSQVTVHSLRP